MCSANYLQERIPSETFVQSRVPKTTFVLVGKIGKLSLYARQGIINLHQLKKNDFQIANEIREGDNIHVNVPIPVLSLFLTDVLIKQGISMTNLTTHGTK